MTEADQPLIPVTPLDASTVLLIRDSDDGIEVFMVVRHSKADFASGALVFPGGKVDTADPDLVATALREADEEVSLPRTSVEILGGLDTVRSPVGFVVQPVLGLVAAMALVPTLDHASRRESSSPPQQPL